MFLILTLILGGVFLGSSIRNITKNGWSIMFPARHFTYAEPQFAHQAQILFSSTSP